MKLKAVSLLSMEFRSTFPALPPIDPTKSTKEDCFNEINATHYCYARVVSTSNPLDHPSFTEFTAVGAWSDKECALESGFIPIARLHRAAPLVRRPYFGYGPPSDCPVISLILWAEVFAPRNLLDGTGP